MGKIARRTREERQTPLETLLNALTVDQLRSVLVRLDTEGTGGKRTREDLIESISSCGRSVSDILENAYRVEAETPPKHFVAFKCSGSIPDRLISKAFDASICPNLKKVRLVHLTKFDSCISLTFEHNVNVIEWEQTDNDTKKKRARALRHPLFARYYPNLKLLLITYPGFSQGLGTKKSERVRYDQVVGDIRNALQQAFSWSIEALPLRTALDNLNALDSKRVRRIKANPTSKNGRLTVSTSSDGASTEEWLANFVGAKFDSRDRQSLENAIKEAFRSSPMDLMVLFWPEEGLCTRIEFWNSGCEFLFIWNKAEHSYDLCLQIFELQIQVLANFAGDEANFLALLKESKAGDLFTPSDVLARLGGSEDRVRAALLSATKAGFLEPVYRLKTELIVEEIENDWTRSLSSLARTFTIDGGDQLDGCDPRNIEIAFERVVHRREGPGVT